MATWKLYDPQAGEAGQVQKFESGDLGIQVKLTAFHVWTTACQPFSVGKPVTSCLKNVIGPRVVFFRDWIQFEALVKCGVGELLSRFLDARRLAHAKKNNDSIKIN